LPLYLTHKFFSACTSLKILLFFNRPKAITRIVGKSCLLLPSSIWNNERVGELIGIWGSIKEQDFEFEPQATVRSGYSNF